MKSFSFSLETLLQHRKKIEEKERTALARINYDLHKQQRRDEEIEQKRMQMLTEMGQIGGPGSTSEDLSFFYPYLNRLRYESDQTRRNIRGLEKELQEQRNVVLKASREKKVIDSLKTKKQREYEADLEKQEQKAMDETAVYRFGRRSTS